MLIEKMRERLYNMRYTARQTIDGSQLDEVHRDTSGDLADLALDDTEAELTIQIAEAGSKAIGDIDRALKRMEAGTYGICEACGKEIPVLRLKALPFAAKCVPCQEIEDDARKNGYYTEVD